MTAPCKDCPNRFIGCHASCGKYIAYRKEQDEYNEGKRKKTKSAIIAKKQSSK